MTLLASLGRIIVRIQDHGPLEITGQDYAEMMRMAYLYGCSDGRGRQSNTGIEEDITRDFCQKKLRMFEQLGPDPLAAQALVRR